MIRQVSRDKLFAALQSDELVRLIEDMIAAITAAGTGGGGGGSGTVTSVSVATANGFSGVVANATTTPLITLRTSLTGLLKGNGTAMSVATSGTDYETPGAAASAVSAHVAALNPHTQYATGTALTAHTSDTGNPHIVTAAQAGAVPTTRTVNGLALSANITLAASDIGLGSVTNDVQTKAAVVPNTVPGAGQLLVGNGTAYAPVSSSGDVTVSSTGVFTIGAAKVTYAQMQNVSATSRILGRRTAGAGSPEEMTLSQTLDLVGSAANGDLLIRSGGVWARLAAGAAGQVLGLSGGIPAWIADGWEPLANGSLGSAAASMATATFTARKRLKVLLFIPSYSGGGGRVSARFNGDTTVKYNWRHLHVLAGGTTWVNTESGTGTGSAGGFGDMMVLAPVTVTTSRVIELDIDNNATIVSKGVSIRVHSPTGSQSTRPTLGMAGGEWIAGAAGTQITSITFLADSGVNLGAGSGYVVLGRDY